MRIAIATRSCVFVIAVTIALWAVRLKGRPAHLWRGAELRAQRAEAKAAVKLVPGGDHGERLAGAPLGDRHGARLGERATQETGERGEGTRVRLLLAVEPEHRLETDEPDAEAIRVLTRGAVRVDEVDRRDRLQLAAALVEDRLDVRERLEPRAEPRLRPPDPLRHRPNPAALEGVEVEHAVGLAEAERAQHDR